MNFDCLLISSMLSVICYKAESEDYPMPNSGRESCGLLYTYQGCEIYDFGDKKIYASENTLTFIPKGAKYKIYFEGERSIVTVFNFLLPERVTFEPTSFRFSENNKLGSLFEEAERIWKRRGVGYKQEAISIFYRILALAEKNSEAYISPSSYKIIEPSVKYLHEHYTERDFKIEELHGVAGINPKHYRNLFIKKFGVSPKEYVTLLRLKMAEELLLGEKYSITQIALLLGFCDVYHFSKVFKEKKGISPSEYKNNKMK